MIKNPPAIGKVFLIGAGPGHPGLITCRGLEALQACDAVVYDDLIPLELVVGLPSRVEKHYVGKRSGCHSSTQADINELLIKLALRGLNVARLKGGDPSVFGRSGEEISALILAGVPAFIIPGVTAASAAAAFGGISLTDRSAASWLLLATGRSADSDSPPVPWRQLAVLKGGTICLYMGVGELENIAQELKAGGMDPHTPVLITQNAGSGIQRNLSSTLGEVVDAARKHQIQPPALTIIGSVAASFYDYNAAGVLAGKRILVTRPSPQGLALCRLIREYGGEPIPYPTINLEPFDDIRGWDDFKRVAPQGGWCVFTSEAGVDKFFKLLLRKGMDIRILGSWKIAAIGAGSATELWKRGLKPDLVPVCAQVRSLAKELAEMELSGSLVVRVRGNRGDDIIEETARNKGAEVLSLTVYNNQTATWPPQWKTQIISHPPDYITFTSGSTVEGFIQNVCLEEVRDLSRKSIIISIGPSTSAKLKEFGLIPVIEAEEQSGEGLIKAIIKHCQSRPIGERVSE